MRKNPDYKRRQEIQRRQFWSKLARWGDPRDQLGFFTSSTGMRLRMQTQEKPGHGSALLTTRNSPTNILMIIAIIIPV